MGWNSVNCEKDADKDFVIFWVSAHQRGTRRWPSIVDDLVARTRERCEEHGHVFESLTPHLTAGRKARFRAPRVVLAVVLAELELEFKREVEARELVFDLGPIPQRWLERARVAVERARQRTAAEGAAAALDL